MNSTWIGRQFLSSFRTAASSAFLLCLLVGCGGAQPAPPPKWTTWVEEDNRCSADIAGCVSRCDAEEAVKPGARWARGNADVRPPPGRTGLAGTWTRQAGMSLGTPRTRLGGPVAAFGSR